MAEATAPATLPMNRREFLFYIWGASMALAMAGSTGAILWFAFPIFREGEFGGVFRIPTNLPTTDAAPQPNEVGRYWLVNTDEGVLAIYKVCTHLGCLYKWVPANDRFECPCHGSKFTRVGQYIEGPAPRNLDQMVVRVLDANGNVLSETKTGDANQDSTVGGPTPVPAGAVELEIDTGDVITGALHE